MCVMQTLAVWNVLIFMLVRHCHYLSSLTLPIVIYVVHCADECNADSDFVSGTSDFSCMMPVM